MAVIATGQFADLNNIKWSIVIEDSASSSSTPPTKLTLAPDPFMIEGDADDMFSPLQLQTGNMNIICDDLSTVESLMPKAADSLTVTLYCNSERIWKGYIQQEAYSQSYDIMDEMSIPVMCPFSYLEKKNVSTDDMGANRVVEYLYEAFVASGISFTSLVFPSDYSYRELQAKVYRQVFTGLKDTQWEEGDETEEYPDCMNYQEMIEEICKFFGWQMSYDGNKIYFMKLDDSNAGYGEISWDDFERVAVEGLTNPTWTEWTPIVNTSVTYVDADSTIDYSNPYSKLKISTKRLSCDCDSMSIDAKRDCSSYSSDSLQINSTVYQWAKWTGNGSELETVSSGLVLRDAFSGCAFVSMYSYEVPSGQTSHTPSFIITDELILSTADTNSVVAHIKTPAPLHASSSSLMQITATVKASKDVNFKEDYNGGGASLVIAIKHGGKYLLNRLNWSDTLTKISLPLGDDSNWTTEAQTTGKILCNISVYNDWYHRGNVEGWTFADNTDARDEMELFIYGYSGGSYKTIVLENLSIDFVAKNDRLKDVEEYKDNDLTYKLNDNEGDTYERKHCIASGGINNMKGYSEVVYQSGTSFDYEGFLKTRMINQLSNVQKTLTIAIRGTYGYPQKVVVGGEMYITIGRKIDWWNNKTKLTLQRITE